MADVKCPRAKTHMTPCIARDGETALCESGARGLEADVCVGCGIDAREALHDLAERHEPARRFKQAKDRAYCARKLQQMVADYVEEDT